MNKPNQKDTEFDHENNVSFQNLVQAVRVFYLDVIAYLGRLTWSEKVVLSMSMTFCKLPTEDCRFSSVEFKLLLSDKRLSCTYEWKCVHEKFMAETYLWQSAWSSLEIHREAQPNKSWWLARTEFSGCAQHRLHGFIWSFDWLQKIVCMYPLWLARVIIFAWFNNIHLKTALMVRVSSNSDRGKRWHPHANYASPSRRIQRHIRNIFYRL